MNKELINNVITAVVTAAVLGALGFFMGVFEKGASAMNEDQIEIVIEKVMVLDSGKTYKARMSELDVEIARAEARQEIIRNDLDDLEDTLFQLVSD